jgi:hypothetical protein
MKTAILLQGDPRFCKEFDLFLENLKGFDQVDYFIYFWENNYATADLIGSRGHQIVAPFWQQVDRENALKKFKKCLPPGHTIVSFQLANQEDILITPITENICRSTNFSNMWKMLNSLYMSNQSRVAHELANNFTYDLVIRSRPDVALMNPMYADQLKSNLEVNKKRIIIPNNKVCGHNGIVICDLFGVGTSHDMTIYCDLYNQVLTHHKEGTIFHPETMLGVHLLKNGLNWMPGGFNIEFRHLGIWQDRTTGEQWTSNTVPTWDNKIYISNFGQWA